MLLDLQVKLTAAISLYCQVEQQKLLKLKEQSDTTIKKLNTEIQVTPKLFLSDIFLAGHFSSTIRKHWDKFIGWFDDLGLS